eukprot:6209314-Prymnesium_polylepis.1
MIEGTQTGWTPALRRRLRRSARQKDWTDCAGDSLDPLFARGAVALLDADWLVLRAKAGAPLVRRQELSKDAFITVRALKAAGILRGVDTRTLPIVLLS